MCCIRCVVPDVTPMYCARCYTDVLYPMLYPMYCARCYTDVLYPMLHPMCCTRCCARCVVPDVLRPVYTRVCRGALPLFRHIAPTGRECNKTQSWGGTQGVVHSVHYTLGSPHEQGLKSIAPCRGRMSR